MKILFFDTKKKEERFFEKFLKPINSNIELLYSSKSIIYENDLIFDDINAISTFVNTNLNSTILSKFKNLKYIFLRSVGYSNVDLNYCKNNNIEIYNTPNYGNSTVAEYVFSLIFQLLRKQNSTGIELNNKTIGIIGAGRIGKKVIKIAQGFNMKILAYDTSTTCNIQTVSLNEIFKKSDIISINCPLNKATKNLINAVSISKMKQNIILINTARGEIVNTKDLYTAILNKKIKGAALDVLECEELFFNNKQIFENLDKECLESFFYAKKLSEFDNVIITPHIAYNTFEAKNRILHITLSNIKQIIEKSGKKNLILL